MLMVTWNNWYSQIIDAEKGLSIDFLSIDFLSIAICVDVCMFVCPQIIGAKISLCIDFLSVAICADVCMFV